MSKGVLSAKQLRFVEEYLVDLNATQAAIRAGYSAKTASEIGHENLRKPQIAAAIAAANAERSRRTGITADRVLEELAVIAFQDPRHYKAGELTGVELAEGAPANAMRALAPLRTQRYFHPSRGMVYETEYKPWDKNRALEHLGRHFKLFTDKLEVDDASSFADQLRAARERVANGKQG